MVLVSVVAVGCAVVVVAEVVLGVNVAAGRPVVVGGSVFVLPNDFAALVGSVLGLE